MNDVLYFATSSFFQATDGALWKSDGTPANTGLVKKVQFEKIVANGGTLCFDGNETPWKSDGTAAGTVELSSEVMDVNGSHWDTFCRLGSDKVAFVAGRGRELWVSDGTVPGTKKVKGLLNSLWYLTPVGDRVFFIAEETASGRELWVTDGTPTGTQRVTDIGAGAAHGVSGKIAAFQGYAVFVAVPKTGSVQIWRSDGTAEGTLPVSEEYDTGNYRIRLIPAGDVLYFNLEGSEAAVRLHRVTIR